MDKTILFLLQSYNIRHDINDQCYFLYASCRNLIVTSLAAPSIVVLIAYAFGLYVFRFVNPENLATLTEKVRVYIYNTRIADMLPSSIVFY